MRTLALETSSRQASIALANGARVGLERRMPTGVRTAVWLTVAIEEALAEMAWPREFVQLIALTSGPGSFTGLRIGVTTAKLMAYTWKVPLVELDALKVIAHQSHRAGPLSVAMDARRDELFVAKFDCIADGELRSVEATAVVSVEGWLTSLARDAAVVVSGPALEKLQSQLPSHTQVVASKLWYPTASAVAALGAAEFARGQQTDPWALVPRYYRKSYAER